MEKSYSYNEAVVNIEKPGGLNLAIFDVSPTIEARWIAIGNNNARPSRYCTCCSSHP